MTQQRKDETRAEYLERERQRAARRLAKMTSEEREALREKNRGRDAERGYSRRRYFDRVENMTEAEREAYRARERARVARYRARKAAEGSE